MSAPMLFELEVRDDAYKYLWLKSVHGFDASVHCAKCLLGRYVKEIVPFPVASHREKVYAGVLDPRLHYLCGVVYPWDWADNLHVPFEPLEGGRVDVENRHCRVSITNAVELEIEPLGPDTGLDRKFYTCRNFQFGWHRFGRPPQLALFEE